METLCLPTVRLLSFNRVQLTDNRNISNISDGACAFRVAEAATTEDVSYNESQRDALFLIFI